jgi:hypothetical protein
MHLQVRQLWKYLVCTCRDANLENLRCTLFISSRVGVHELDMALQMIQQGFVQDIHTHPARQLDVRRVRPLRANFRQHSDGAFGDPQGSQVLGSSAQVYLSKSSRPNLEHFVASPVTDGKTSFSAVLVEAHRAGRQQEPTVQHAKAFSEGPLHLSDLLLFSNTRQAWLALAFPSEHSVEHGPEVLRWRWQVPTDAQLVDVVGQVRLHSSPMTFGFAMLLEERKFQRAPDVATSSPLTGWSNAKLLASYTANAMSPGEPVHAHLQPWPSGYVLDVQRRVRSPLCFVFRPQAASTIVRVDAIVVVHLVGVGVGESTSLPPADLAEWICQGLNIKALELGASLGKFALP